MIFSVLETAAAVFLLTTGAVFTAKTRFRFWNPKRLLRRLPASKDAFFRALSGTLGIGNIVGVSRAIQAGGAGAVFWIFLCALVCGSVKSAEIFVALKKKAKRPVAVTAMLLLCAATVGAMAQSNAAIQLLKTDNNVLFVIYSVLLIFTVFLFLCLPSRLGGRFLSGLTPVMAGVYLLGTGAVVLAHIGNAPTALYRIFTEAFCPQSAVTGAGIGAILQTMRAGCLNGLFSHEAGLGSAQLAHTSGEPETECLFGAVEVYTDSILVSGLTALCLLTSGTADIATAFSSVFGSFGHALALSVLAVFALSSILCWAHYADTMISLPYITKIAAPLLCLVGLLLPSEVVWQTATLTVSLTTAVNLVFLIGNAGLFFSAITQKTS